MNKDYEHDIQYEVWRMGGNPDGVDSERCEDYYDEELYPEEAAQQEINIQHKGIKKGDKELEQYHEAIDELDNFHIGDVSITQKKVGER